MPRTFKCDTTNHPEKFPKQVKYQKKKYGCVGWYKWSLKYLGTKWDAELCPSDDLDDMKIALLPFYRNCLDALNWMAWKSSRKIP